MQVDGNEGGCEDHPWEYAGEQVRATQRIHWYSLHTSTDKSLGWNMKDIRAEVAERYERIISVPGMDNMWGIGGIQIMTAAH